ncbi:MAG TPA: alpha-L-arabinofuranosidase C-terminal domain-containing protein [Bryobacteraceae bacterium]|nr:alpha-L-arabinofuranosidase C-terminal domain-containing protein [Bryobacteraceae bacterium]
MPLDFTRRQFACAGAASLAALLPRGIFGATSAAKNAVIHADVEIGLIRPEFHSNFAEHLGSCTYGGIWVGKKSPIPNINGLRKAAVDFLKELGVPVLRWPGGCYADDYHWRDGIGPAEKRPRHVNVNWGKYVEDNSFGTHEFIEFCRLIGAEPYFAANVGSGSPQEMRDWIEYCNFPKGSTLSDERAANGSPEPFRVKYWGVGNELWGCGGNFRPEQAAEEFRRFATFARLIGDRDLYLVGCGPNGNDARWTRGFMDTLQGSRMPNGYSMHYYENGSLPSTQFTPEAMYTQFNLFPRVEQAIIEQRTLLDSYDPGRNIGLFLDEWGVWDQLREDSKGRLWQQSTMRSAVAAALGLNIFNRQADKLYMCNIAQLINVLQAVLLTDGPEGKNCVRTTSYYAFMLFKPHRSKKAVRVEYDGDRLPMAPAGRGGRGGQQPEPPPDLSMSASRQDAEMIVTLVNPRHDVDMEVDCAIRGASARQARAQILHDSNINAANSFDDPEHLTIKPHQAAMDRDRLRITLPAMSVVTVTLQVA